MTLGTDGKYKFYIVKRDDEPAEDENVFEDYTTHVLSWNFDIGLNKLTNFSSIFIDIDYGDEYLSEGNFIYGFSGTN